MPELTIAVKRTKDGEAIARALADPETYALVVIIGCLLPLNDRNRQAILQFAHATLVDPLRER